MNKEDNIRKTEKYLILSLVIIAIIVLVLSISDVLALDSSRENRLAFGHVLYVNSISMSPEKLSQGVPGTLKFSLENTAADFIKDVRIELSLPAEIAPYNDITKKKIAYLDSGETADVSFSLVPLPSTEDGVYKASVQLDYVNYIGDERQENDTISIIVGGSPKLYAEFKSSDIYQGNNLGTIKINVVNNNVGNVKFLTASLGDSQDYKIIGSDSDYIGDLNSDDFSESSFKIQLNSDKKVIELPLTLSYKDGLNKDYAQKTTVYFEVPTAKEAGIKTNYAALWVLLIPLAIIAFIIYRRYNKNIMKMKKAALSSLKIDTKF